MSNAPRYGSDDPYGLTDGRRVCLVCSSEYEGARPSSYCSGACRQRAFRVRRSQPRPTLGARERLRQLDVLYECSHCGERYLNERRCESCNRFCARVGAALPCPHCDEPILFADIISSLGEEVADRL